MAFEIAIAAAQMTATASAAGREQSVVSALGLGSIGFYVLLFAGCVVLAALAGMVSSWVDRKVTALVQARVGPPASQPFWDFIKLMGKETLIPAGANRLAFVIMPIVAVAAVALAVTILMAAVLWQNGILPSYHGLSKVGIIGDLIVVLYLLAVPSLALIIGASSSNNPFASIGASREMKLMSYELPLLLAVAAALTLAAVSEQRYTRELQSQVNAQVASTSPLYKEDNRKAGLVSSVVPLRFDQLLVLRNAAPESAKRTDGELGLARLHATIRRELRKVDLEISYADRNLERLNAQSLQSSLGNPESAAKDNVILRQKGLVEAERRRLMLKRLPLALEEARLRLGALEQDLDYSRAMVAGMCGENAARAQQELKIHEAENAAARTKVQGEIRAIAGNMVDAGLLSTADGQGGIRVDGAKLVKASVWSGLSRWATWVALGLCVVVALMCAQAKLGMVPFDCAEAEGELAGGVLIEYGGSLLAAWKLARHMLLFVMPIFIGMVFLGGFRFYSPDGGILADLGQAGLSILKYVGILVVFVLVRNTNPRVRIDQAMRFFLGPMTVLAAMAVAIAVFLFWILA